MTVKEKRVMVAGYCARLGMICDGCVLKGYKWRHCTGQSCLDLDSADEEELDRALNLIGDAFYGVEAQTAGTVIQLEAVSIAPMQIAYAICKFYEELYDTAESALIDLDELTEHIGARVRAYRKALEYKKLAEEG